MIVPDNPRRAAVLGLLFVAAVALANYATSHTGDAYHLLPIGFGLKATAGTVFAGACLALRDALQDAGGRRAVLLAVAVGAAVSAWTSSPALALASGVAFAASELVDAAVYTPIRRRARFGDLRWTVAVAASGIAGSVVDSLLFLSLAGIPILTALPGQLVGKSYALAAFLVLGWTVRRCRRAVPRNTQLPASA
jgi:uncharacterized PurR-regulated membrane protein YhhQ (DUF165 family)